VIVMARSATMPFVVDALQRGADGYVLKR